MRTLVGTLVAALALSGLAAPPAGAATSSADTPGSVHEADIEALATSGITRGCNPPANDRYCPDEPVTRGQMAVFLVRALKLRPAGGDMFTDDNGSVFEADINALAAAGVTKGCNPPRNDRYCPDEPVTRGQMAAFLVRARRCRKPTAGTSTRASGG